MNGGAAPQTRAKAQQRLAQAADVLMQRLLGLVLDGDAPDAVALAAIRYAPDYAGLNVNQAIELTAEVKPWQSMLQGVTGIQRGPRDGSKPQPPDALAPGTFSSEQSSVFVDHPGDLDSASSQRTGYSLP